MWQVGEINVPRVIQENNVVLVGKKISELFGKFDILARRQAGT